MTSKDLENKSSDELAAMREGKGGYSQIAVLVKEELERRARIHQHELDRKLIMEQVKWMRFSVYAILFAAILSVFTGYYLTTIGNNSLNQRLEYIENIIQIQISEKEGAHHKEIIEQ